MDVSEIFESLNEPQRNAVTSESKNLLVLAGAGSGKTRVIAHRVAWLIKAENINPHSILTVTFTNKASREMRGRIEDIVQEEMGNFWCGTFHGISHRLLRTHWKEAGLRKEFAILDSEDQCRVIKRVVKSMGLDDTKWPPRQIQWFINKQKDECRRSKDVEVADDYFAEKMAEVYKVYEELCERESLVDFGELLLRVYILLKSNAELLKHYQRRFSHLLVDEFQDTNAYNEDDEARYVVGSIQNWVNQGRSLDEVAILYRSNAQSRVLEEAILRESLPYKIYGGLRFYERAEIKNAMSYLRLLYGREDDAAFERVINIPPRGIGAKTIDIIRAKAAEKNISLWKACEELIDVEEFTARASQSIQGFMSSFNTLESDTRDLPLRDIVDMAIERSGLIEYHKKEAGEKGRTRVENY